MYRLTSKAEGNFLTRVVVIQHVLELSQRSNTVRAASGVEVRMFGVQGVELQLDDLINDAVLLWPGASSDVPSPKPKCVVVLDGSWSQARRMTQRVPALRSMKRWSLVAPEGRVSLRAAPPGGMSSLEAIGAAVLALDGEDAARPFLEAHAALIKRQMSERGYVGPMPPAE